jgi:hypothetical protein
MLPALASYLDLARSIIGLLTALIPFLLLKNLKNIVRPLKKI